MAACTRKYRQTFYPIRLVHEKTRGGSNSASQVVKYQKIKSSLREVLIYSGDQRQR